MLLLERNIANGDQVDKVINDLIARVPKPTPEAPNNYDNIVKWLKSNLRNWLINDYPNVRKIDRAEDGLPDWLIKKAGGIENLDNFLRANEIFFVNLTPQTIEELFHVVDFLLTTRPPGTNPDGSKRPGERLDVMSVPVAMQKAEFQHKEASKPKVGPSEDDSEVGPATGKSMGAQPVMEFKDGFRWVKLNFVPDNQIRNQHLLKAYPPSAVYHNWRAASKSAILRRETALISHCVGAGGYDEQCRTGSHEYYSLRDPSNMPHATAEIRKDAAGGPGTVLQIKGKANAAPAPQYVWYIAKFLEKGKFKANTTDIDRMGIMRVGERYLAREDLEKMPPKELLALGIDRDGLRKFGLVRVGDDVVRIEDIGNLPKAIRSKADLTDEEIKRFYFVRTPNGEILTFEEMAQQASKDGKFTIKGNIEMHNLTRLVRFPKNMTVDGNMVLHGYIGGFLPEGLVVTGTFTLRNSRVVRMPTDMKVGGDFSVEDTPIENLPLKLNVTGKVSLRNTRLKSIEHIRCTEMMTLGGTGCSRIGPGVECGGLQADGSELAEIDPSFLCHGLLSVNNCKNLKALVCQDVGGSVSAKESGIVEIRENFKVGTAGKLNKQKTAKEASLELEKTPITKLPAGLVVPGSITLPPGVKDFPPRLTAGMVFITWREGLILPLDSNVDSVVFGNKMDHEVLTIKKPGMKPGEWDEEPGQEFAFPFNAKSYAEAKKLMIAGKMKPPLPQPAGGKKPKKGR